MIFLVVHLDMRAPDLSWNCLRISDGTLLAKINVRVEGMLLSGKVIITYLEKNTSLSPNILSLCESRRGWF